MVRQPVLVHFAGSRFVLTLIFRFASRVAVRDLTGEVEELERDLTDRHIGPEADRKRGCVGKLQGDRAFEAWVDEPGGRVDDESEPTEGRLSLKAPDDVVRETEELDGRAKDELARMKDEGAITFLLSSLGQIWLFLARIDVGAAIVAEDAEETTGAYVKRRRLDGLWVEGIDADFASVDQGSESAIANDHVLGSYLTAVETTSRIGILCMATVRACPPPPQLWATKTTGVS